MTGDPSAEPASHAPPEAAPLGELVTRAASSVVLAAAALGLLYAGALPFAAFVGVAAVLTSWEWSRIVRGPEIGAALIVQVLAVALAAALAGAGLAALALAVVAAGAILVGLLSFAERPLLSAAGVLYAGLPAVALLWLREDAPHGLAAVLLILAAVAATDVAAFITGRLVGGPKLAPVVSPNKTWSGLIGGVAAAALAGFAVGHVAGADPFGLAAGGAALGFIAQLGDLAESALKRHFGIKDSSDLIPGHGGVMDRVDGLVFASVAAALAALAINPHAPAGALLFGW